MIGRSCSPRATAPTSRSASTTRRRAASSAPSAHTSALARSADREPCGRFRGPSGGRSGARRGAGAAMRRRAAAASRFCAGAARWRLQRRAQEHLLPDPRRPAHPLPAHRRSRGTPRRIATTCTTSSSISALATAPARAARHRSPPRRRPTAASAASGPKRRGLRARRCNTITPTSPHVSARTPGRSTPGACSAWRSTGSAGDGVELWAESSCWPTTVATSGSAHSPRARHARRPCASLAQHLRRPDGGDGWAAFELNYDGLEAVPLPPVKATEALAAMLARRPRAARLVVRSIVRRGRRRGGRCREVASYEGASGDRARRWSTARLEGENDTSRTCSPCRGSAARAYWYIEPIAMWQALLGDSGAFIRRRGDRRALTRGLARAIVGMVQRLHRANPESFDTVALSGGVFQNATLLEQVMARLRAEGSGCWRTSGCRATPAGVGTGAGGCRALRRKFATKG